MQIPGTPNFYNIHMTLRIFNVTERDFGKYQCLAKNAQGDTTGEINLYGKSSSRIIFHEHL